MKLLFAKEFYVYYDASTLVELEYEDGYEEYFFRLYADRYFSYKLKALFL